MKNSKTGSKINPSSNDVKNHRKWYDRTRTYTQILGDSRTVQSERDPSDVNTIVARFQRTGELPSNPRNLEPQYEDVTGLQENLTDAYNKATSLTENYHQFLTEQQNEPTPTADPEENPTQQPVTNNTPEPPGDGKGA